MAEKFSHSVVQCLTAIAQHHGIRVNPERLIHDFALADEEPSNALLVRMANEIGLKSRSDNLNWDGIVAQEGVFPLLARLKSGAGIIVVGVRKDDFPKIVIVDPQANQAAPVEMTQGEFGEIWSGEVVFLKRSHSIFDTTQPFSLRWFIPEILKQKKAFRDVAIAAMAMNVLALASPMFFQIVTAWSTSAAEVKLPVTMSIRPVP